MVRVAVGVGDVFGTGGSGGISGQHTMTMGAGPTAGRPFVGVSFLTVPPCRAALLLLALTVISPALGSGQAVDPTARRPARAPDIFFVPTSEAVADQMLTLAGIRQSDVVYDLGSGDGRIVMLAAQKYGARGVGIEIDPALVARAREVARQGEVGDRVRFVEGDLFAADISEASLVTLYLSPSVNARLEAKLRGELRPGARVVSHQFSIGRWPAERVVRAEDGTHLYLWTIR